MDKGSSALGENVVMLHRKPSGMQTGKRIAGVGARLVLVALWSVGCADHIPGPAWAPDAHLPAPDAHPPAPDARPPAEDVVDGVVRLRVMAGNLTSGNVMSYDPGHGIR